MKLCSRLLVVFGRNFCEKQIWVSEPHFHKVRDDARPWLMLVGKPIVDFLFTLIDFFALCYGSTVMRRNVYSSAVFTLTFYQPRQGRPPSEN